MESAVEGIDKTTWKLLRSNDSRPYFINNKTIVNQLYIEELGVRVVVTGKVDDVFRTIKRKEIILVFTIIAFLAALSFVYYALASTITKRILLLARHMRNLDDDNMKQFNSKHDKPNRQDEIGFLTSTYNSMIRRMDELINNVHRSELRNKEAAYKVLQAQIKPHFLYNTLETIRMLAESNNDKEVADISFWFGKLMRYSLSPEGDRTVLAREIETVIFYLNIHKMRLQDRMTYEVDAAMDAEQLACPRFMLQPLVENSIVHGASAVLRPVHIKLQVRETEDEIRISIADNGTGIQEDKLMAIRSRLSRGGDSRAVEENEGGVGLFNVSERIKSFFGGSSQLVIDSGPDRGTCLTIIIIKGGQAGYESIDC
ncbi:Sensor histidine kinase YehU [compost metagenome]